MSTCYAISVTVYKLAWELEAGA